MFSKIELFIAAIIMIITIVLITIEAYLNYKAKLKDEELARLINYPFKYASVEERQKAFEQNLYDVIISFNEKYSNVKNLTGADYELFSFINKADINETYLTMIQIVNRILENKNELSDRTSLNVAFLIYCLLKYKEKIETISVLNFVNPPAQNKQMLN